LNISVNQIYNKSLYENLDFLDEEKVKDWLDKNPEDLLDKDSPFKCLGPSFLKNYNVTQIKNIINDYKNLDIGKGYLMKNKYTSLVWEKDNEAKEYEDFDLMIREFYKDEDKVELKKGKKKGKKEGNKFDRAKKEYEKRVTNLGKKMTNNEDKATWIYENADEIDRIIEKVNSMNRNYVEEYIEKMESSLQPIKYNCKEHKLIINKIEIFCDKSAYANGNTYFNNKKKIKVKYNKTIESGGNAINKLKKKEFENKKKKDLDLKYEYQERNFWFQQYNWYIMDNRFLIISGKSADQNEEIVKKYLNKDDKYIHGNFFGSPSMIIKDMKVKEEIPLQVLLRGGDFLVCMSNNWKVSRSEDTYYVNPEQVSKTAPSGEYVTKGSFMIRGNKNYLPNANLELGIGILFIDGKGDEIEYISKPDKLLKSCIPVIGPYRDMKNKYKYCVKVKPGNQKQGKVINAIITKFMKLKEGNENEKFLIKKIKKDLWCKIVRSNVHLIL
jgi:predicted ribosome quality control (RQC) complex YloA/Tae2 family protein